MQDLDAGKTGYAKAAVITAGFLTALIMSFVLLIAAVYIALYSDSGYYEREYLKYDVINALPVEMTMSSEDGVLAVSDHMMEFLLKGNEPEDLQISVTIDGETREFFSEREIAHMADVRFLFRMAIDLFFVCAAAVIILNVAVRMIFYRKLNQGYVKDLGRGIVYGTVVAVILIAILVLVICSDFSTAFVTFHHIFFDNDLWLLDPYEDLMINLLPESFFADTALRIVVLYIVLMIIMLASGLFMRRNKKSLPRN